MQSDGFSLKNYTLPSPQLTAAQPCILPSHTACTSGAVATWLFLWERCSERPALQWLGLHPFHRDSGSSLQGSHLIRKNPQKWLFRFFSRFNICKCHSYLRWFSYTWSKKWRLLYFPYAGWASEKVKLDLGDTHTHIWLGLKIYRMPWYPNISCSLYHFFHIFFHIKKNTFFPLREPFLLGNPGE